MDRNEARNEVNSSAAQYLQRDRSGKGYICPVCGSGGGKNGTGITSKDGIHFTCWAGCFTNSDLLDIIGIQYSLDAFPEKLNKACELLRIPLDDHQPRKAPSSSPSYRQQPPAAPAQDQSAYFAECHARIEQTDYWKRRGLSREVVERFNLGYDPNYTKSTGPQGWKALIIPTSSTTYAARNTDPAADKGNRYRKFGNSAIFNRAALLAADKPLFVVEGELDALAIMSAGGEAVGLGSTSNADNFLRILKTEKPKRPLLLALDRDEAGQKAAEKLAADLQQMGLSSYRVEELLMGSAKDAGEAILQDRERFCDAVKQAEGMEAEAREAERAAYMQTSAAAHLESFADGIMESVNTPAVKTGFASLDNALDGGLYEGLYVVGAISSLGKTTLVTQIADQIADAGHDVIIFSLEMARSELMSKSISRQTLLKVQETNGDTRNAKTARGITDGKRYQNYSTTELSLIKAATLAYAAYADHIFIHEGIGNLGVQQIRETVEKHISFTGRRPVCIVDYLQILAPHSDRATDKQATDHNVMELKRISRDYKLPLIAISSFNRANYKEAATMEAFKESGAVEYSSDVLIGLQLEGAGTSSFDATAAKQKNPRAVECVILKNRNGSVGNKIPFSYYPMFNYFKEG